MAALNYKSFTLGVEEEYMVLDPATFELKSRIPSVIGKAS
jgi:glutamate---cysteine ligase / carboxylate-amine ligase